MDIKKEGGRAASWSLLDKFLKRGVQFVLSIFLARLLMPEDFGVVAMAAIFVGWGEVFRDFGLGQALVQRKDATDVHASTIFYLNIVMACIIAAIFCVIAPFAASFYDNEMVAWVVRIAGLTFIINGFNVVQNSLLMKELNYKVGTVSSFLASIISGIIGITLAYLGFGVWSLLVQSVSSAAIATIYIWYKSTWRPRLVFNFKETKPLFKKGFGFMGQGLVDDIFTYAGTMVIGKVFSPGVLGIYDRGSTLSYMPNTTFVLPVTRPLFPVFSKLQDDIDALRQYYTKILQALNWGLILVTGIFLIASEEIIYLLLGERWIASAEYFFLLSLIIPFCPNWSIITALWKGLGLVKKVTFVTFIEKTLFLVSIPALFVSLKLYAVCIVASHVIANILKSTMNSSVIGVSVFKQYREWSVEIIFVASAMFIWHFITLETAWLSLILKIFSFVTFYVVLSSLCRLDGYRLFRTQANNMLTKILKRK